MEKARPVIRVTDLWKEYTQDGHEMATALAGTNLEIAQGEIVALFGKSGSGKSTLLNLLAGLDQPTRGVIEIDGEHLASLSDKGLTRLRRVRLGFIFQFFNLLPTLTVFENVFLSLELLGNRSKSDAIAALYAVGLEGKEHRYPYQLSGGEQQRVAVARAIVKKPPIILADEPTGNLDNKTGEQILGLLQGQCRAFNTTLLVVSHSVSTATFADRTLRMVDGQILDEPAPNGMTP
jgi:putative ABC transport system ATP-binding protein